MPAIKKSILDSLFAYAADAPASNPGEGYWADLDVAFGCGERCAQFEAAKRIRALLHDLGYVAPEGVPLCPGCSRDAASGHHDPDCALTVNDAAPALVVAGQLPEETAMQAENRRAADIMRDDGGLSVPQTRTDAEIVRQANELAIVIAADVFGLVATDPGETLLTYEHRDPRMQHAWRAACIAFEHLQGTPVAEALANIQDD